VADEVLQILKLRAELLELGSAIRQLNKAGMDSAAAQLLMTRKRAELEDVTSRRNNARRDSQMAQCQRQG
jgi:hypothetical protein